MTEKRGDTQVFDDTDFILDVIQKEYVSQEVLLMYEQTYRELKRVAISFGLDTTIIDEARDRVMRIYGQS